MLDLKSVRQRAATRVSLATVANPATWLIQVPPISQLATLAGVASERRPAEGLVEALADAINRACDIRGDDAINRAGLLAECAALPPEGQADLLAHFTIEAARWVAPAPDSRVTCTTCRQARRGRCGSHKAAALRSPEVGRDLAALMQRCAGFQPREVPR